MKSFKELTDYAIECHYAIPDGSTIATIQTLIQAGEYFIKFIDNHVYYDFEPCNFDHHGYCQDHQACGNDKCSNTIITKQKREIEESVIKLKKILE
jgi:hypothetical protein